MAEDPLALLQCIRQTYKIFEFKPADAKDYEHIEVELSRELHAAFVMKGFDKMPKGMTGLDSGQPWFIFWLTEAL